ncbi:MAG: hypothetical protein HY536_00120 [Candidatus Colwellbacteria bacterium]|nr:hypothetical protein [Candidatus Colwellbacteria bacterium]
MLRRALLALIILAELAAFSSSALAESPTQSQGVVEKIGDAVMNAASKVGESVTNAAKSPTGTNTPQSEASKKANLEKSASVAPEANPARPPIPEGHDENPTSPGLSQPVDCSAKAFFNQLSLGCIAAKIITDLFSFLLGAIAAVIKLVVTTIVQGAIALGSSLLNAVIGATNAMFAEGSISRWGFDLVLIVTNALFVLAFLASAFGEMIGWKKVNKRTLIYLIPAVLLVNLSFFAASTLIKASNEGTNFFLRAARGKNNEIKWAALAAHELKFLELVAREGGGSSQPALPQDATQELDLTAQQKEILNKGISKMGGSVGEIFFTIILGIASAAVLFWVLFEFTRRYVFLNLLVILLPVALLVWAFPLKFKNSFFTALNAQDPKSLAKLWAHEFVRWLVFGPVMGFFIFLAFALREAAQGMGDMTVFLYTLLANGILVAGLYGSTKVGLAGGAASKLATQKTRGWLSREGLSRVFSAGARAEAHPQGKRESYAMRLAKNLEGRFAFGKLGTKLAQGIESREKDIRARVEARQKAIPQFKTDEGALRAFRNAGSRLVPTTAETESAQLLSLLNKNLFTKLDFTPGSADLDTVNRFIGSAYRTKTTEPIAAAIQKALPDLKDGALMALAKTPNANLLGSKALADIATRLVEKNKIKDFLGEGEERVKNAPLLEIFVKGVKDAKAEGALQEALAKSKKEGLFALAEMEGFSSDDEKKAFSNKTRGILARELARKGAIREFRNLEGEDGRARRDGLLSKLFDAARKSEVAKEIVEQNPELAESKAEKMRVLKNMRPNKIVEWQTSAFEDPVIATSLKSSHLEQLSKDGTEEQRKTLLVTLKKLLEASDEELSGWEVQPQEFRNIAGIVENLNREGGLYWRISDEATPAQLRELVRAHRLLSANAPQEAAAPTPSAPSAPPAEPPSPTNQRQLLERRLSELRARTIVTESEQREIGNLERSLENMRNAEPDQES